MKPTSIPCQLNNKQILTINDSFIYFDPQNCPKDN